MKETTDFISSLIEKKKKKQNTPLIVPSEFKAAPDELLKSTKCNCGGKYRNASWLEMKD